MSNFDRRALMEALKQDASRMGISVPELIQRITSGAHVIGAGQAREMIDPATYLSTGTGRMPQIQDRQVGETDDFEDFAQRHEEALIEAGGDDLSRDVILRDDHRDAVASDAVHVNPKSAIGAMMGQTVTVTSGDDPSTVAYWAGDDEEATNVTVTLAPGIANPPSQGALPVDLDPFARLTWGTRAQQVSADIDVGRGGQFTISASSVTLRMGLAPTLPLGAGNASMSLAGMLSFRQITHPVPVTRTVSILGLAAGGDQIFNIPAFAKAFRLWRANANIAITITVLSLSGGQLFQVQRAASATGETLLDPIVLPNSAAYIAIHNSDGALQLNCKTVFDLSL